MEYQIESPPKREQQEDAPLYSSLIKDISPEIQTFLGEKVLSGLRLVVETYPMLANFQIEILRASQMPTTGGYFYRIEHSDGTYTPGIAIAEHTTDHSNTLFTTRSGSIKMVEKILGKKPKTLTPEELFAFIVFHELGHAKDFAINYVSEPDFSNTDDTAIWDEHYQSVLSTLPFPGVSPKDLVYERNLFSSEDAFLAEYPEFRYLLEKFDCASIDEFFEKQDTAYRNSSYEKTADLFAKWVLEQEELSE